MSKRSPPMPPRHPVRKKSLRLPDIIIQGSYSAPVHHTEAPDNTSQPSFTAPHSGSKQKTKSSVYPWDVLPPPELRAVSVPVENPISPLMLPQSQHEHDQDDMEQMTGDLNLQNLQNLQNPKNPQNPQNPKNP